MERSRTAVALGLFDGVHLGHRAVIGRAVKAAELGYTPAVFTFSAVSVPSKQGRSFEYIYTDSCKAELMGELGIAPGNILSADFGQLKDLSGEEFVRQVLLGRMNAGYLVCGKDFRFGRNASCGFRELLETGERLGITVEAAEDVVSGGENISSRCIRRLLTEGETVKAAQLLGQPYTLKGEVVYGNQIGRTIDFPTVNLLYAPGQLVPRYGVYSTETLVGGRTYRSVTNVGVKPTIAGDRSPLAETHILDFSGDLYGSVLSVRFREFLRPEMKFGSLEELKSQIARDISRAGKQT